MSLFLGGGFFVALALIVIWAVSNPEKAERVAGWLAAVVSRVYRKADKAAVAWKVQGDINTARTELLESAPPELLERGVKIKWTDADEAEALLKEGEVLVCMQRSDHHERNVANAVMAFLPKSMLPNARRYLDKERMRAADLIVAKGLLDRNSGKPGTLAVFFEEHLDPARAEDRKLREKIDELDEVDLQGWLVRLLLVEYLRLGEALHPSEPEQEALREAEELARWTHKIATRMPGEEDCSLAFTGRYFRVAVIFVGIKDRLLDEGLKPYRKRAKRLIYRDRFDAIYLMARDRNMGAVEELASNLEGDGRIASVSTYRYLLRSDFKSRYGLDRERAIISCVRRRRVADTAPVDEETELDGVEFGDLPEERYETVPPKLDTEPLFLEAPIADDPK